MWCGRRRRFWRLNLSRNAATAGLARIAGQFVRGRQLRAGRAVMLTMHRNPNGSSALARN